MRTINGIPAFGLGTFGLTDEAGTEAILSAIEIGYRHIDTAQTYGTETNVGAAIARSGLSRDDFFVTTKITDANRHRFVDSMKESLDTLGLDHVDLTLIHWPAPNEDEPVEAFINGLAEVKAAGQTKLIGVSNFTRKHIDAAVAELGAGQLATNQVECHLWLQNRVLADHCAANDIAITAYLPLAKARLAGEPTVEGIAQKHGVEWNHVALAFLLAEGRVVIPKTSNPDRMRSNLRALDVTLDADDIEALRGLDAGKRYVNPDWGPAWD